METQPFPDYSFSRCGATLAFMLCCVHLMNANPSSLQHSRNSTEKYPVFCSSPKMFTSWPLAFFCLLLVAVQVFVCFSFVKNLSGNISESGDTLRNTKLWIVKTKTVRWKKLQTSVPVHNQFKVPCGAFGLKLYISIFIIIVNIKSKLIFHSCNIS